jgi:cation transport ATPase
MAIGVYNFWPAFQEAYRVAAEERRFSILHLMLLYLIRLWFGGYYLAGTIGLLLGNLCHKIELLTKTAACYMLSHLFYQQPQQVWVILDGVEVEIPFEQLRVGDILVLDAGQMVPVDGVIVQGVATLDQHRLTGESQPVEKGVDDPVLAATLVLGGAFTSGLRKLESRPLRGRSAISSIALSNARKSGSRTASKAWKRRACPCWSEARSVGSSAVPRRRWRCWGVIISLA